VTYADLYCNKAYSKANAYGLLTGIDCLSIPLGRLVGPAIGATVACVVTSGAAIPESAAAGEMLGDALVDLAAFAAQNYITQETVVPRAQRAACCRAADAAVDELEQAFDALRDVLGRLT
jgi:hypothetical protein